MAHTSQSPPDVLQAETQSPTRIRRNTACVRCRDAKVKCNASLTPNQPCLRCSKLELYCVVDKNHKRTSRRSKLEELAAEVRNIKEAVAPRALPAILNVPPLDSPVLARPIQPVQPVQLPSPHSNPPSLTTDAYLPPRTNSFQRLNPFIGSTVAETVPTTPSVTTNESTLALTAPAGRPAEPRALGSRVFSGEDITYYFDKYFAHFHPYLPILRTRDPDACYKRGPILFWAIIVTACRRFARDDTVFAFLVDAVGTEIWAAASQPPPLRLPVINALLLLATWPLPKIRFLADPSIIYAGMAMNSCFLSGIHTGNGNHTEFVGSAYKFDTTDEEAVYTWAGCNIINHRVSGYMGTPSTAAVFNKTIDRVLDGSSPFSLPRYFHVQLETSRFANRVARVMSTSLEESQGVSHHLVALQEEEFAKVQRLIYTDVTDLDHFTLLSTLLEIQVYYFIPLPAFSEDILKRNVLKCFTTAETMIRLSTDLQRDRSFFHYAPHFVYRQLLNAVCVVLSVYLSSYSKGFQVDGIETLIKDAVRCMRACSVRDNDLHMRGSNILEKFWDIRHRLSLTTVADIGTSMFTHRLGASLAFDCLRRWRRNLEAALDASTTASVAPEADPTQDLRPGPNPDLGLADSLERIDWNAFMDDFDWSFTQNQLIN
ncbi:hypothetical protein GQ53DRAFT_721097 [Thozetella sp. PMI_491]|nr:hypothetical protein GQ53DRAFT_721097 [Thozetella sp. PMI_491]